MYTHEEIEQAKRENREISNILEFYKGVLCEVKDRSRSGWWRFYDHYDRNGYCDNPSRGY